MPDISASISKLDNEQQIVFGWAYVSHDPTGAMQVDKSGDFITSIDELEKSAYEFVLNSRDGGEAHIRKGVSTMVESMVFTPEKVEKMGLPQGLLPTGWWVGFKVHDDEVWKAVKEGRYKSFSIHGSGVRKKVEKSAQEEEPEMLSDEFRYKHIVQEVQKHGDKGEPGYGALHPKSRKAGFSGGASGAGASGGRSRQSAAQSVRASRAARDARVGNQPVRDLTKGKRYRANGVEFTLLKKKRNADGTYTLDIKTRPIGNRENGNEITLIWPASTLVTPVDAPTGPLR